MPPHRTGPSLPLHCVCVCVWSQEDQNAGIEITLPPPGADAEEAEHNRLIRERLAASMLASTSGKGGKGGKGGGKG